MGKRMKSYLVFTGLGYRVVMFIVIPVVLTIFGTALSILFDFPGYLLSAYMLPTIEIMADAFVFEGIASKKIAHLEYLKTSKRGIKLMRDALQGGMIRMLISSAVLLCVNHLIYLGIAGESWNMNSVFVLLWFCVFIYVIAMSMLVIARFFISAQVNYILGFFGVLLELLVLWFGKNLYVSFVILVIIGIAVSVFSVKIVEKRMRESYYDKTV